MNESNIELRKSLNKAFLKVKPDRSGIERFKANLIRLLDRINPAESEEFHKNLVISFLRDTWYSDKHFMNTRDRSDLVIHLGKEPSSRVGVIIEVKKPANRNEMISSERLNAKAFQELLLYYLRERITGGNIEIKNLVITNIYEWYVFDAHQFDKYFASDKELIRQFVDFETNRMSGNTTDFFYNQIARPVIEAHIATLTYTRFDLHDYDSVVRNTDKSDDNQLIALFKIFSPEHLLKLPFANDSNSLDNRFYRELLYLIGLEETREGSRKLIGRFKPGMRHPGSLIENTINILNSEDRITHLENQSSYGSTREERLYQVALELVITWINRILFLKLLEGQLLRYHKNDPVYRFLDTKTLPDYDSLNRLFFQVLAVKEENRNERNRVRYVKVPYLNSSLFEISPIERKTITISALDDESTLPVSSATVLRDSLGKRISGEKNTLDYLMAFLDAYDFSSEGSEEIQEENKTLINASVLGLIFEKINGYKDGSFYTPGFITMFMCREAIHRAVIHKFNKKKGWDCTDLTDLYNKIEDRREADTIINDLKICDPAVGSGHFLVSALNEIIAIKSELGILADKHGRRLKDYNVEVVNDELIVTDEEGRLFEYRPGLAESQRVQETLFREKQTIIENCLFGVDINPNSVKICRLRLWIELLKNAYYTAEGSLETLPNIDINIKCGNSLISRYPLDADIRKALKGSVWTIESYRQAVMNYRNARNKEEKREMESLIERIKKDFETEVATSDRRFVRRNKLKGELDSLTNQGAFWDLPKKELAEWNKKVKKITADFDKLDQELLEIRNNRIFENAFEWRFEFPEVLDENGDFGGFDVVIGNPPYIRQEEITPLKPFLESAYQTYAGTADLFVYFVERGLQLTKTDGEFIYILANKWMRAGYGKNLREYLLKNRVQTIIDFGDLPVFEEATTYPCILSVRRSEPLESFNALNVKTLDFPKGLDQYVLENSNRISASSLGSSGWVVSNDQTQRLLDKIKSKGIPLSEYVGGKIYRGVLTGLNEAFVINSEVRDRLISEDPASAEIIKPFLAGRDIKRYQQPKSDKYLIFTRRGIDIGKYPAVLNHLLQYQERLEPKPANYKDEKWPGRKPGSYKWYEIQDAVDYYQEFEKPKIIWPGISDQITSFAYDRCGYYGNDNNQLIITDNTALLGLLNSSLVKFFLANTCDFVRGGFVRLKIAYIAAIPIHTVFDQSIEPVQNLVFKALSNQESIKHVQAEIDQIVYQLYGLTEDEIRIVEGA